MNSFQLAFSRFSRTPFICRRSLGVRFAFAVAILFLSAAGARADVYYITFMNVTFSATCAGGSGTCTEVINGSALYDAVADSGSDSTIRMTGSLTVDPFAYGNPACTSPNCLNGRVLYDPNVLSGFNPIEFGPDLPTFDAPTPQPLPGGPNNNLLFVPAMCGGDQAHCNTAGGFPSGGDFQLTSGTYTSVDVSTPEPASILLFGAGFGVLVFLPLRRGFWRPRINQR